MLKGIFSKVSREHLLIVGMVIGIFLISANIAWLNPKAPYVIKTNERIPVMWQYNGDAAVEFLSGAHFPDYYKVDKTRINRPGYPALVKVLGEIYGILASPFIKLGDLLKAMLGYITLKVLVYLTGAIAMFSLVRRYFSKQVALLSVALLFLHPFAITFIGTFHTSELQFITPIFLIFFWFKLGENYSWKKNVLFSLIVGLLMLSKQNYAVYFSILIFSFFVLRRYKETVLSFLVHLAPLTAWILSLKLLDIPYYNHESANGLGVWLYRDLIYRNPLEVAKILILSVNSWLILILSFFSLLVLLSIHSLSFDNIKNKITKSNIAFILIFLGFSWVQTFAANRYAPYMTSDLAIIIVPLAALALYQLTERYRLVKYLPYLMFVYLLISLITIVGFPWMHPYEQKGIFNPERVSELNEGRL